MFYDNNADYFCDNCDVYLNDQPGFTAITGQWVCSNCGYENDVSENNTFDLLKMIGQGITEFTIKKPYDDDDY